MAILYKSEPARGAAWAPIFARELPDLPFRIWPDIGDPESVRFMVAWTLPEDMHRFRNLEVLYSIGAGIDQLDVAALPADLPVVRMIEPGLVAGMVEFVCLSVLALHRDLPVYLERQRRGAWRADRVHADGGRDAWASWGWACSGGPCSKRSAASAFRCPAGAGPSMPFPVWIVMPASLGCRRSGPAATFSCACCRSRRRRAAS